MTLLDDFRLMGWWFLLISGFCWRLQSNPILEGASYTMNCSGQTISKSRNIYWIARLHDGTSFNASRCLNKPCVNTPMEKYKASYSNNGYSYTSLLTIMNVTAEHRRASFECQVIDYADQESTLIRVWELSWVYRPPKTLHCQANLVSRLGDIQVSCQVEGFYPDIVCCMTLSRNGKPDVETARMKNHDQLNINPDYYMTNCSSDVYPKEPGRYTFRVNVFPGECNDTINRNSLHSSPVINITSDPVVMIRSRTDDTHECPRDTDLECIATWFEEGSPQYEWYLDNASISEEISGTITERRGPYYTYISRIKLAPTSDLDKINVTCKFYLKHSSSSEVIHTDTKMVQLTSLSLRSPYFRLGGEQGTILHKYHYDERRENITFVCQVQDEGLQGVSVTVLCAMSDNIIKFISNTNSVVLSFKPALNVIQCQCSSMHTNKCYNSDTNITLLFGKGNSYMNTVQMCVVISVTTFVLIGLTLIIGAFLYLINHYFILNKCSDFRHGSCHIYETITRSARLERRSSGMDGHNDTLQDVQKEYVLYYNKEGIDNINMQLPKLPPRICKEQNLINCGESRTEKIQDHHNVVICGVPRTTLHPRRQQERPLDKETLSNFINSGHGHTHNLETDDQVNVTNFPDNRSRVRQKEFINDQLNDYITPSSTLSSSGEVFMTISDSQSNSAGRDDQEETDHIFENDYIIPTSSTSSVSQVSLNVGNTNCL